MQYKFHLQENLSFKNLRVYLIINELRKPLKERFFQGQEKVSVCKYCQTNRLGLGNIYSLVFLIYFIGNIVICSSSITDMIIDIIILIIRTCQ